MAIGFSLMFGLQFVVAWAARALFGVAGDVNNIVGIPLIFTVAVYFGGGLVMSLLSEEFSWFEPLIVAALAVVINAFCYFLGAAPDLTFVSVAFTSKAPVLPLIVNFGSVILAALAGGFVGARIQSPNDDWISRGAILLGIISLIIGPFLLLTASGQDHGRAGLPWYVVTIIALVFLVIVGIGYALSNREHHEADEISISPDHRKIV
jgi:hypothetical protein